MTRRWSALLVLLCWAGPALAQQELGPGLYAVLETSRGRVTAKLFHEQAPMTVANFVGLAEGTLAWRDAEGRVHNRGAGGNRFYENVPIHRVVPGFIVQTGDPSGTGQGGPGYFLPDEFHPGLRYDRRGRLAMANAGPHTNGSQFFITLVEAPWLDYRNPIFGTVVEGMPVVQELREGDRLLTVRILRMGGEARSFAAEPVLEAELREHLRSGPGNGAAAALPSR